MTSKLSRSQPRKIPTTRSNFPTGQELTFRDERREFRGDGGEEKRQTERRSFRSDEDEERPRGERRTHSVGG